MNLWGIPPHPQPARLRHWANGPTLRRIAQGGRGMAGKVGDEGGALDRMTESVYAKFAVRVLLPTCTAILIPIVAMQWNGITNSISKQGDATAAQSVRLAKMEQDVATINTKLDAGLVWRLSQLERRFEAMESRQERREAERPSN